MTALERVTQAVRRYAGAARRKVAAPTLLNGPQRPLFLFCGKSHAWREPGRGLYRFEPLFRDGIDDVDALVRGIVGFSPSAAFSGQWLPSNWSEEARSEIVTMSLAQMGLADLWRASGNVEPGFLGLSGGEIAATYGAGILSREEAVRTICWIAMCVRHPAGRCTSFGIEAHEHKARLLCRSAPRLLEFGGEVIPGISQVRCEVDDVVENRAYLQARSAIFSEHGASFRYHVPDMGLDEDIFAGAVPFIRSKASHPALYLCSFGGRVPEGYEFSWRHWAWMASSPYRMGAASAGACGDGFNRPIVAGSMAIGNWHMETSARMGRPGLALNAFADEGEGLSPWERIRGQFEGTGLAAFRQQRPASGGPIDLADPVHLGDPYSAYERLRLAGPVQYLPRQGFWIVLGQREIRDACGNPAVFSNEPYGEVDKVLIGRDPPEHGAVRRTIASHFDSATLKRLEQVARDLAPALVKARFDVVTEFAEPFSNRVAAEFLGFDADGLAAVISATEQAQDEARPLRAVTHALDRLACRSDAYHRIKESAGGGMSDSDVRSLVRFLWLAAITTTGRVIARSAMQLLQHEDLLGRIREDRGLLVPFIEEVMRLYPPEHMLPRRTTQETTLGGVAIPAGCEVQLCTTAANRDPEFFEDPATFRLDRASNHLSFGSGIHHCSGTALARRLIPIAVGALVDSPGLRAFQPMETIDYLATIQTRVPKSFVIGT